MSHQMLMTFFAGTQILFAFAFGSCVGSLINVLAYRMPLGLSVVSPPSRCPKCDHLLGWRDNIPVFGWLFLRGKCRFCKVRISAEYPIVEAFVGLIFVLFYVLWYIVPDHNAVWLGFDWSTIKPEWAMNGFGRTWPIFVTLIVMVGSLIAMTIIDARTFTIPLSLTWTPAIFALVAHPLWALWLEFRNTPWRDTAVGEWWALPTPGVFGWPIMCAAFGALLGLLIANILLALGLIRRSFADYDEWEEKALAEAGLTQGDETPDTSASDAESPSELESEPVPVTPGSRRLLGLLLICLVICGAAGAIAAPQLGLSPILGAIAGILVAVPLAGAINRLFDKNRGGSDTAGNPTDPDEGTPAEMWIQYPHARREVGKELIFLAPCIGLAVVGWFVGLRLGAPWSVHPITYDLVASNAIPLWCSVLGGVALGYLAGGGIVWAIRIFGTLGFGKEAMGLGDVHLLAAVGACIGWIDAVLAFFAAPFIALYIVFLQAAYTGNGRKAMPYGPYLAIATLAVVLGKVGIEAVMTKMFGSSILLDFP